MTKLSERVANFKLDKSVYAVDTMLIVCVIISRLYFTIFTLRPIHWAGRVWCSGNASDPTSKVTVHRAGLVLRWVTVCGQVNHLGT